MKKLSMELIKAITQIKAYIDNEDIIYVDFEEGYLEATPEGCTEYLYFEEEEGTEIEKFILAFDEYEKIYRYVIRMVTKYGWHLLDVSRYVSDGWKWSDPLTDDVLYISPEQFFGTN